MKMPRDEMPDVQHHESEGATTTPLDRLRSMSTVAHKVKSKGQQRAVDAMLAVYNGRLTYTFIAGLACAPDKIKPSFALKPFK